MGIQVWLLYLYMITMGSLDLSIPFIIAQELYYKALTENNGSYKIVVVLPKHSPPPNLVAVLGHFKVGCDPVVMQEHVSLPGTLLPCDDVLLLVEWLDG